MHWIGNVSGKEAHAAESESRSQYNRQYLKIQMDKEGLNSLSLALGLRSIYASFKLSSYLNSQTSGFGRPPMLESQR
jgi:hypothetical protein